jgi:hypothetical protein
MASWQAPACLPRGGQPHYSDVSLETSLLLRSAFRMPLRQAQGPVACAHRQHRLEGLRCRPVAGGIGLREAISGGDRDGPIQRDYWSEVAFAQLGRSTMRSGHRGVCFEPHDQGWTPELRSYWRHQCTEWASRARLVFLLIRATTPLAALLCAASAATLSQKQLNHLRLL